MAGRDHHFIPQLLQKGFSAGQTRKNRHQVRVFRRGQEPFKTGTWSSCVERDFYGPPSAALVDQLITDEETRLDKFVVDARASSGGASSASFSGFACSCASICATGVAKHEDVGGVTLALSSTHALVGKIDPGCAEPTALALNVGSAAWSGDAFIASDDTAENRRLHALSNTKVGPYLESQIKEALEESGLG